MKRYTVRPQDDYSSWGDYDTIEEAREAKSKLAMSFFSRRVIIIDNNITNNYTNKEVE